MKNAALIRRLRATFQGAWDTARMGYQRARYLVHAERNFTTALHSDCTLHTPAEWLSVAAPSAETAFFGYYDKSPWSPDGQRMVVHELGRDGQLNIVVFDAQSQSRQQVATTSAWNYQQGAMTQWLPGSNGEALIFNDMVDGRLVSRIVTLADGASRTLPWPIQVLHPSGSTALFLNYRRLDALRPDYGYQLSVSNFEPDQPLEQDGIWWLDVDSGSAELRLTIADLITRNHRPEMDGARHKVNHFYYAPDGQHFIFMHRWLGAEGKFSRLYVSDASGQQLRILLDDRTVSHYSWQDESHIVVWGRTREKGNHYYLINVHSGERRIVGPDSLSGYGDGHPTFSPDRRWIITDTYPDQARQRHLLLFNVETNKLVELGRFFAPWQFNGVERCDLHPRWSRDGRAISIDSAHSGTRQTYVVDVSAIVAG